MSDAAWEKFAPQAHQPSRLSHAAARLDGVRRVLTHEWTLASLAALAVAVMLNREALADLGHTIPQDIWDPTLLAYLIAWDGHALIAHPGQLWQTNAFYPAPYGLAYSDAFLGYAPLAFIGSGPVAAVVRYNIIFILAQALSMVGGYALARQLGAHRFGATVAAVGFALAPWRLGQFGHLQVISTGGIALSLAMLARGHGIRWRGTDGEPRRPRPGWVIGGWLVATWQLSIGFGIGIPFLYVLLGSVLFLTLRWVARRVRWGAGAAPLDRPLLLANAIGGFVFAAVALILARPYLRVLELYPYVRRTVAWVALYSPPLRGYFTAPPQSVVWGHAHQAAQARLTSPGEMALLPGFTLIALAATGLVFSVWSLETRLALLGGIVVSVVAGLGTNGPAGGRLGYLILLDNLPGFDGLRTPGRLVIWTTLALALLAAGAVSALADRAHDVAQHRGLRQPTVAASLALLLPAAFILIEGLGTTPHPRVPPAPSALTAVNAPYLVLPTDPLLDMHVMLWSTNGFAPVVNGNSGITPAELDQTRTEVAGFPDPKSVAYLRSLGVRSVLIRPDYAADSPWADAAEMDIEGLGITRRIVDGTVIFDL